MVIDYVESSPALLPLLIFLVLEHAHVPAHNERQRVRRSHQSGNNILLRRPFTAHAHKSPRRSRHPHCQRVIMRTRTLGVHVPHDRRSFRPSGFPLPGLSTSGRNSTPNLEPAHFTCDDSALALLKRRRHNGPLCVPPPRPQGSEGHSLVTGQWRRRSSKRRRRG